MTEWQSADDRNNRERVTRARQAAEDLFKPASRDPVPDATASASNGAPPAEQPRRQPRIFTVPPRMPLNPKVETPIEEAKPTRQSALSARRSGIVPPSEAGRVRALATYGMTVAQVAELYGVTVDEIKRVIRS